MPAFAARRYASIIAARRIFPANRRADRGVLRRFRRGRHFQPVGPVQRAAHFVAECRTRERSNCDGGKFSAAIPDLGAGQRAEPPADQ